MKLLSFVVLCALAAGACSKEDGNNLPTSPTNSAPSINVAFSATDLRAGTGTTATAGRLVAVRYTGWTYSTTAVDNKGTQFDTSIGRAPLPFVVGGTQVISGFSRGVLGMRVGGRRLVVIPPELAYGAAGRPPTIGANNTLVFEIELLTVQ